MKRHWIFRNMLIEKIESNKGMIYLYDSKIFNLPSCEFTEFRVKGLGDTPINDSRVFFPSQKVLYGSFYRTYKKKTSILTDFFSGMTDFFSGTTDFVSGMTDFFSGTTDFVSGIKISRGLSKSVIVDCPNQSGTVKISQGLSKSVKNCQNQC